MDCFQSTQQTCGNCVGCFKGWVPCLGCFLCCCNDPYVAVDQGSKGLVLRYNKYIKTVEPGLVYVNPIT
jgi:erythrocyte band 7 integral membrane protein